MSGPLPRAHPRVAAVRAAECDLRAAAEECRVKHALTSAEYVLVLSRLANDIAARLVAIERR